MRHPLFARGLDDIRAGKSFIDHDSWDFERGRLFGANRARDQCRSLSDEGANTQ
jgi:hypothetical protein